MGIINNNATFFAPSLGSGDGTSITSFRDDDDFSTELFDQSIVLPSFPNNVGIAFIRSSDSPADYATIALNGTNTSTFYADNTANFLNFVVSGDFFVGYNQGANLSTIRSSFVDYVPLADSSDVFINGRIYANEWNFTDTRLLGKTKFGLNTIEIDDDDNSISGVDTITANVGIITTISGVDTITANVGVITSISGITTITPVTRLNVNGSLVVSGVSTIGIASTSNLTVNSTLSFELISNTNLRIRVRGNDGVTRVGIVTLS